MNNTNLSRRDFLQNVSGATLGFAAGSMTLPLAAAEPTENVTTLTEHLLVYKGHINVGIIRDGDKALLIDCGDASVTDVLPKLGIRLVDQILFTHHHRDQACGAHALAATGTKIGIPAAECDYFDNVAAYWNDPKSRWHLYNLHPHHLMLGESVRVDATFTDQDTLEWGPAKIRVLATPGHTNGSVSYLVQVDGEHVIFSGDVIADEGQVWDIHSLQKRLPDTQPRLGDYHGFMGARTELAESLDRIKNAKPGVLVPSHGRIMIDPAKAINTLIQRLDICYDQYVAISAHRFYRPNLYTEYAGRKGHMPLRDPKEPPSYLRHYRNTWIIISENKDAFVMDCGYENIVHTLDKLIEQGEIRHVDGLWVTHYHDDHVDAIPQFQKAFDCPCITDQHVAQVITNPLAWRLPCVSASKARVDRIPSHGESWQWHEFKMTSFYLPGQTLYHAGLLVEGHGARMFFAGDSFTLAGIDDYCTSNRNWLGAGVGFDRCITLIEKLKPTHIFNAHVDKPWNFTPQECQFMKANLAQREKLFGQLVPWDHANYGMDEPWVRCHPYEQHAKPGSEIELRVVVTNHSTRPHAATCRVVLPRTWPQADASKTSASKNAKGEKPLSRTTGWIKRDIPAKTEGEIPINLSVPRNTLRGCYVIPIDLHYGLWNLPQFAEALVVV